MRLLVKNGLTAGFGSGDSHGPPCSGKIVGLAYSTALTCLTSTALLLFDVLL